MFSKLGTKLAQSTKFIEGKAAAADTMGRFKKYSYEWFGIMKMAK